jgi:HEAT repeat protein
VSGLAYALLNDDASTVLAAAKSLKALKAGAKPALGQFLWIHQYGYEELQLQAVETLPFIAPDSTEAFQKAVKHLDDESLAARRRTAEALGNFGEKAVPVLEERLRTTKDGGFALSLVEGLCKAGPKAIPALAARLDTPDILVNTAIVRGLAPMAKTNPEALAALKKAAGNSDQWVKAEAAKAVAEIEGGKSGK